ncbi:MAG: HAD-IA family hydrolase, partial [Pandoraea sp.]|nr:HAD-IA family hydrolase [Pandoraea sp.]
FDLVVFDWDGTLMDSTPTITRCIQAACRDLGLPVPSDEIASHVIGLGLRDALQMAVPSLDPAHYPRLSERYRFHYLIGDKETVLFTGIRELLEAAGLMRMFDATRCADETFSKPHPAMLQELTRELGQDLRRTVMIGDTTHDLQMAHSAGTSAVAVAYGGAHPREQLVALEPAYCAGSVAELRDWLLERV